MILRNTEHQKQLGAFPVRSAELPKRSADRIDTRRRHVDRTEAAMCRVVRRAERLRPQTGQGLRLVAARKQSELARVSLANWREPRDGQFERLVPSDLLELTTAAWSDTFEGCAKPRRRIVLHDTRRAFGAQNASVHRMVAVAFDITNSIASPVGIRREVNVYAASASAHVTRGLGYLFTRRVDTHALGLFDRHGLTPPRARHVVAWENAVRKGLKQGKLSRSQPTVMTNGTSIPPRANTIPRTRAAFQPNGTALPSSGPTSGPIPCRPRTTVATIR